MHPIAADNARASAHYAELGRPDAGPACPCGERGCPECAA